VTVVSSTLVPSELPIIVTRRRRDGLWHSAQTQDCCQGFVDTPLLFGSDPAD
jgi:hypothetical protein